MEHGFPNGSLSLPCEASYFSIAFNLEYEEVGSEVRATFYWTGDFEAAGEQRVSAMANLTNLVRHLLGPDFAPLRVEFMIPQPADLAVFEDYFQCPLAFDCPRPLLVLDRALMDPALPRGHAEMAQMSDELVIKYLRDLDRNGRYEKRELHRGEIVVR